jgi:2,5-dihydroxypyridine 5,6-dioxygenase
MASDVELLALFEEELSLCKVGPGQTVAVLSEGTVRGDYAQACCAAALQLGAQAFHLSVPPKPRLAVENQVGTTALTGNRPAIEALKRADIVIDLLGLLFSPEQLEITQDGTRILQVLEPVDILRSMFPTPDLRRRVEFGSTLLGNAKELRVTSEAGTDVHYRIGQYGVQTEYGYTDTPGRWDHWPSGFLLTQGNDGEVNGSVVLMPGDILNDLRRYVESPVRLAIEHGFVTRIEGDGLDAALVRGYIDSYNDPRGYAISHIGWGLNERAKWHHLAGTRERDREIGVHGLAYYGNVLFSLGPNSELGGSNDTACHLDIPMRNCSLWLDGKPIVASGRIVPLEMRAPGMPGD